MIYFQQYLENDPKKKNEQWGTEMVTYFRTYWKPLVSENVASQNMDVILSRYNMGKVMKMFKDPNKLGMDFMAIAIMEKVRNILVGEITKAGLSVSINALDPVAEDERKKDRTLLENKKEIEQVLSFLQESIGLPEYKMQNEKKISGKDPFGGNMDLFDELSLNSDDPNDRGYFMKAWHRLKHEMDAQEIVNSNFKANELEEYLEDWVNDILAKKVIAKQAYVNEMSGAMDIKYIAPEIVRLIPGKRNDGKDSVCLGYEEPDTIGGVIKKMGNGFSMERDWQYLLNAVNYTNKSNHSGIWDGQTVLYGAASANSKQTVCHINEFMSFKVNVGYIEWKSLDAKTFKVGVDFNGNLRYYDRGYEYNPEEGSGYAKESWYNEFTYKAYYLATSSNTQKIYKFGKLFHQVITGANDEYSSYSISFRKVTGPPVAEIARPWIEIAQECFTKFRWMIRRAKPKGRSYNYESLVQIAKHMIKTGTTKDQVHQVIQMFEEGINEIFTIPKVDGQRVGGGIIPNADLPNGLDATAVSFQGIIDWAVEKIKQDLGINDIREAYSPKQNDVYKLQAATLESSRNATNYIPVMLDGLMRDCAKHTLLTAQDIIKYKTSMAYDYLLNLVGAGPIQSLERLNNVALHRYGIFVTSYNSYLERQNIMRDTDIAFQNGEITYDVKLLINAIDDFRKAAYILAFEKQRAQKIKEKEIELAHTRAMERDAALHNFKIEEINAHSKGEWNKADRTGWWMNQANSDDNKTKMAANEQKGQQRLEEIVQKMNAELQKISAKLNIKSQEPIAA